MTDAELVGVDEFGATLEEKQTLEANIESNLESFSNAELQSDEERFLCGEIAEQPHLFGEITKEIGTSGEFDIFGEAVDKGFARYNLEVKKFETMLPDKELSLSSTNMVENRAIAKALLRLKFDWIVVSVDDWQNLGDRFRLVVPFSVHRCANPYLDNMVIEGTDNIDSFENNIPTWIVLADDSIVITSDSAVNGKILIKGDK